MHTLFATYDADITDVSSSELCARCAKLPGTHDIVVNLTDLAESLTVTAIGSIRIGDCIPVVPLSRDRDRNAWRGSVALGKTVRFLRDPRRNPGSSRAVLHSIHAGRAVVLVDGSVFGVLASGISACVKGIPAEVLGDFCVGCPGEDLETGLVHAVLPSMPADDPVHLARVLAVWEYASQKNTKREVRVLIKTASGVLGVASATDHVNWQIPTGQHVNVTFKPMPLINPPSDTNCDLMGADFRESLPPAEGSTVDAIVIKVQPYGAFCLVANGVEAMMHRTDCGLNHNDDIAEYFSPGDRVQGILHRHDKTRATLNIRLKQVLERRTLPSLTALFSDGAVAR
jgi:hypothetical protein